ncbi:MAG: hypothetical protein ILP13_06070, partial [Lachnospiraceae bacterium]|nr:hypothetical protein [Lachnospiraceae bacterium]
DRILSFLGGKLSDREALAKASCYLVKDLWTGEEEKGTERTFTVNSLEGCDCKVLRITPLSV